MLSLRCLAWRLAGDSIAAAAHQTAHCCAPLHLQPYTAATAPRYLLSVTACSAVLCYKSLSSPKHAI